MNIQTLPCQQCDGLTLHVKGRRRDDKATWYCTVCGSASLCGGVKVGFPINQDDYSDKPEEALLSQDETEPVMAVYLGDGWHVVERWRGLYREYTTICGRYSYCHPGGGNLQATRIHEVVPDLWPEAEPAGRVCGCYWYFRREEVEQ